MNERAPARLFIFTGFLGSGKTTVINSLLAALRGRSVGLVVNEWGKLPVDGSLLSAGSGEEKPHLVELSGGQIFCSCMSSSFLAALETLASRGLDYILVEASGLAKPASLGTLAQAAIARAGGSLVYGGSVCVVDAARFALLRRAATVVDEQVAYADRFVVTKTDMTDPAAVKALRAYLIAARPDAFVVEAPFGSIGTSLLDGPDAAFSEIPGPDARYAGWGARGRPKSTVLRLGDPVEPAAIESFLRSIASSAFRIKGFVRLNPDNRGALVDCVEDAVSIRDAVAGPSSAEAPPDGLAIIWKDEAEEEFAVSCALRLGIESWIEP